MTIKDLLKEEICNVVDHEDVYYVIYTDGNDAAVVSINKKTKEMTNMYSLINNMFIEDLVDQGKAKLLTEEELERFKQSLKSFK